MGQHRLTAKRSVTEHPSGRADTFLGGGSNPLEKEGVGWLSFNLIRLLVKLFITGMALDRDMLKHAVTVSNPTKCAGGKKTSRPCILLKVGAIKYSVTTKVR